MAQPLKVGIAGLGTVGASVARMIDEQRGVLAARCGRAVEVAAVSARSRGKKRGVDLEARALVRPIRWRSRPIPASTCSSN